MKYRLQNARYFFLASFLKQQICNYSYKPRFTLPTDTFEASQCMQIEIRPIDKIGCGEYSRSVGIMNTHDTLGQKIL